MTVATNANKVQALGNGVTTAFPYSFRIFSAADLIVTSTVIDTGVDTLLVLNTDYTVTGAGSYNGGNVVCVAAPEDGTRLTIRRVLSVTQNTDLRNQGAYFAESHEDVFDRLTMVDQQQQEAIDRSIVFPATDDTSAYGEFPVAAARANNLLGFDADGKPVAVAPAAQSASALQALLAASSGASLVGDIKNLPDAVATTQAEINARKVHVFDFLTPAQRLEAASGTVTLDMSASIQKALDSEVMDVDFGRYTYLATGLTVPVGVRAIFGTGTVKCQADSTVLMQWLADTSRESARLIGGGLKFDANGKTGATGLKFGSVTNNPSAGAQEAILYLGMRDMLITGFDTNLDSRVSMEHSFDNVTLKSGIVGMKLYSDSVNGGCNANTFRGLRLQGNQVGCIVRNMTASYAIPLHNNQFDGLTLQENAVCGIAFIGAVGQSINSVHIESNGTGAASIVIDGTTIFKADVYLDSSQVEVSGTDLASSLSPCFALVNSSRLTSSGLTGYGSSSGSKVSCDSTSSYHEIGPVSGIGVSANHASYGQLIAVSGLGFMHGAPLINITRGANLYPSNPMYIDVSNTAGVDSAQNKKSEFGLTPEITFAGTAGSTGSNRFYMNLMTCVANKFNISSFLIKSDKASSLTFNWIAGASQLTQSITTVAGAWKRVVFVSYNKSDHQLYIYPSDAAAASIQIQGVQCASDDLPVVASIYASGTVNTSTQRYNAYVAAPTTGAWAVGDVVWNSAPAAGGSEGWVCTTAGTPGTWKLFGTIAA